MKKIILLSATMLTLTTYALSCDTPTGLSVGIYRDGATGLFWNPGNYDHSELQLFDCAGNNVLRDTIIGPCHDCYHYKVPISYTNQQIYGYWRVRAICIDGILSFSPYSSNQVLPGGCTILPPCPVPSGLTVFSVTSTSAQLSWDNSSVDFYYAGYKKRNSNMNFIAAIDFYTGDEEITHNFVDIDGLKPNTKYIWRVASVCNSTLTPVDGISGPAFTTSANRAGNLNEIIEETLSIYPSPSNGNINLTYPSNSNAEIQFKIYDIEGREVYHQVSQVVEGINTFPLNFTGLNNGVYVFELSSGITINRMKFIIEK